MIQCRRVYDQPQNDDGYRILVDRLWPRGMRKTDLQYDEWAKCLAPSTELRKAFHSEVIDFATFSQHYRQELKQQQQECERLVKLAAQQTITLLYGASNLQQNHARVLADWLLNLTPASECEG